jgi:hypothetical protein
MRYLAPLVGLLLVSAAAVLEPATAQPNRAREGVQSGEVRSLDEILNGIRRERPGSLADVEGPSIGPYGEPHYRLKWLTPDGRVLWLDTDARTGRVLGVQGDDRAAPPGAQAPRGAQGQTRPRPNFRGSPADEYDFGAPGIRPPRGGPTTRRPVPEQNFAPGREPDFYRPPPGFRRPPPPPNFRRGPPPGFEGGPPPGFEGRPPPQRFDRGPERRGSFDRGPRGFDRGSFAGGGRVGRGGLRGPEGRAQRRFR